MTDPTRILAPGAAVWQGAGAAGFAGRIAAAEGWTRVLLVRDPGIAALPATAALGAALHAAGIGVRLFDGVQPDPPVASVAAALAALDGPPPDAVVSLGGGSAIDTAKALAACLAEGRGPDTLPDRPPARALPHLAVPTTAGTGAEASNSSILTDAAGRKRAIIADCLAPRTVLLDPSVLAGQPRGLVVSCGLDAFSHGLESLVSRQGTTASRMLSRECIRLVAGALPRLLAAPDDATAMEALQLGAHLGGAALRLARLGYAHAIAHAAAEHRHAPHGLLVAQALPEVLRFNAPAVAPLADEAAAAAGFPGMAALLDTLLAAGGVTPGYRHLALTDAERAAIVARCVAGPFHQWNPRRADAGDFGAMLDRLAA
jgi:alcohol dehydrogenase class IV